ncbi:MAG TPA: hypothetical protein VE172_10010 [Stackebrandtia sp.]|jgi:hypothetical protein|uniref:hypothetical protein n=1 Tax=Stackebrandtia sp. TaxID=2023065 RepID=UPI002D6797A6|nr:hypothetical protein [Stackebrandtia sp.]HZE39131.1 hypothetical protein [Stackebrandtia sp.]
MNDRIHVDRRALRQFIDTMHQTARDMAAVRDEATPAFTGNYLDTGIARWQGGVKVTLGAVNYPHRGREAGEILASRIVNTVNYVISIEEGSRAMAAAAQEVLHALDRQDSIAADDLGAILRDRELPGLPGVGA